MFFVITTTIGNDARDIYAAATPAHDDYLERHRSRMLIAGSLVRGNGASLGSLCILEADSLLSAAQFVEADPMTASGAVTSVDIAEWRMAKQGSPNSQMAGWADEAESSPTSVPDQGLLGVD